MSFAVIPLQAADPTKMPTWSSKVTVKASPIGIDPTTGEILCEGQEGMFNPETHHYELDFVAVPVGSKINKPDTLRMQYLGLIIQRSGLELAPGRPVLQRFAVYWLGYGRVVAGPAKGKEEPTS
jgi:hypothetical protein